jgi:multicomponent Na+:H+ antiporter subunit D
MGIAFAANMFTLFVFYELLTISTYPLVTHKGTPEARRGGRIYLGILFGTSIGFQLVAVIWTWTAAGTLDFTQGGILTEAVDDWLVPLLLALYAFGIGKAALMPFHFWLPSAMVAPTPVSAFLHAVAVVKAGVFSVLKVVIYIFGLDFLTTTGANVWLIWVSAGTILIASLIAITKDNLKARLAYSTISQLSYVILGAAIATSLGVVGGAMQIAMHAMGKITLFMCAGAIYVATHKTLISELDGLGRVMPFTFGAFLIGSLSIIGLPPTGGAWSKWFLMMASVEAGDLALIFVLMASSILNVAYLIPIAARGFFAPSGSSIEGAVPVGAAVNDGATGALKGIKEAPLLCVIPLCLTAIGCIALFFFADPIFEFLEPIGQTAKAATP